MENLNPVQWTEEQEEQQEQWTAEPQATSVVPDNADEVAAQFALADDGDNSYDGKFEHYSQKIAAEGVRPTLESIAQEDRATNIEALKATADEAAKNGDAVTLEATARMLDAEMKKQSSQPSQMEGLMAAGTRAAELVGVQWAQRKNEELGSIAERAQKAGVELSLRNIILFKIKELEGKTTLGQNVGHFMGEVFASPYYEVVAQNALNKFMKESAVPNPLSMFNTKEEFVRFMQGLDVTEQAAIIDAISKEAVGMGESTPATIRLLQRINDLTAAGSNLDAVFNALTVVDVIGIGRMLKAVAQRGKPSLVLQRMGGDEAAAQSIVSDLTKGTKITGLTETEQVAQLLAMGRNPYDFAVDAQHGMSSAGQERLRAAWNQTLDRLQNRLISSGVTPDEVKDALAKIREKYMQSTDPAIRGVFFKEGSEAGQRVVVEYIGPDGKSFLSKESAEQFARERNLTNYEVVPRNIDELPISKQEAFHGTDAVFSKFRSPEWGGQLGHGVSVTTAKEVADLFAQQRGIMGRGMGFGPVRYTVDIPENELFMRIGKGFEEQTETVKSALLKVFSKQDVAKVEDVRALYDQLIESAGSSKAASKTLDEAGIAGLWNEARTAGANADYPEHLVFNPKKVRIMKEELLPRGESRLVEDKAVSRSTQDVLQELVDSEEAMKSIALFGREAADLIGEGYVRGKELPTLLSGNKTHITASVPKNIAKTVDGWVKLLKLDNDPLVFGMGEDIFSIARNVGIPLDEAANLYNVLRKSSGIHVVVPDWMNNTGKRLHMVFLNKHGIHSGQDMLVVAAHELGHMFDVNILSRAPTKVLDEMVSSFKAWAKERGADSAMAKDFFYQFRFPKKADMKDLDKFEGLRMSELPKGALESVRNGWYADVGEWWAENFAKFMLTDARPVGVVEQFFANAATILKEFFASVARTLGFPAHTPDATVRSLMDSYLNGTLPLVEDIGSVAKGTSTYALRQSVRMLPTGKPHIKGPAAEMREAGEWMVRQTVDEPLPYSAIGKYTAEDIQSMPMLGIDPKHRVSEQAMEERVIGVHAEAKTRKDLSNMVSPFFDKLDNKGREKVLKVLERGDQHSNPGGVTGKEYNYSDLRTMGLNEPEAEAYFAARQARMMSYHLRNKEMVRNLRADGYREIEFAGMENKVAGRVLDRAAASQATLGRTLYNMTEGKSMSMTSDTLDKAYAGGMKVVQLASPMKVDKAYYYTLLADDGAYKAREIVTALHYRPGEFSRIYTDEYFIKVKKMQVVDGAAREVDETVRTATTAKEAAEYVAAHKAAIKLLQDQATGAVVPKNIELELEKLVGKYGDVEDLKAGWQAGELDGYVDMYPHYTRTKEEFLNGSVSEAVTTGRLFTSKRSEKLFSVDRDRVNTLNPYEALEAELTNISRVANVSQWRESQIRKWMNTFGHMLPSRTGNDVADFLSVSGTKFTHNTREAVFAERTHAYIMKQIGVRTEEERFYANGVRMLTEVVEKRADSKVVNSLGTMMRKESFIDFIRSVNFNFNLGMFNPAQLVIQANGAMTALAISPLHGLAAAKMFPLLRLALMSDNPAVWSKLASVETATSLGLSSKDEFVKVVQAIRKSGIIDNVRSTALWNMESGALNLFNGIPRRALKEHTFFFDRGEEFSRVVAFDVARREWMKANPGKEWATDEVMKSLVVRMDDLTQNMTRANLASFQEGLASIPLQFAQYHIKLASNIMTGALLGKGQKGRGFSRAEAASIFTAHLIAYGLAGNGLMWIAEEMFPEKVKAEMSEAQKMTLAQGAVGWMVNTMAETLSGKPALTTVGERLGAFNYWEHMAKNLMDGKLWEAVLGPSMSTVNRLGVIGDVAKLWYKDPDLSGRDIVEGLGKMTVEQIATTRNVTKAYLMMQHGGKAYSRDGAPMATVGMNEMLFQALGFSPASLTDTYALIQNRKDHQEALREIARLISDTQRSIIRAHKDGDKKRAAEQEQLMQSLWPDNAGDLMEVRRIVQDEIFPHDTVMNKLLEEYLLQGQTHNKPLTVTNQPRKVE